MAPRNRLAPTLDPKRVESQQVTSGGNGALGSSTVYVTGAAAEAAAYAAEAAASEAAAEADRLAAAASEAAAEADRLAAAASAAAAAASATAAAASAAASAASNPADVMAQANAARDAAVAAEIEALAAAAAAIDAQTSAQTARDAAISARTAAEAARDVTTAARDVTTAARDVTTAARDQTVSLYDLFDDRFLGAKAADPALDNDGNAIAQGALYFRTTAPETMRVYRSTGWADATAQVNLVRWRKVMAGGETSLSGNDDSTPPNPLLYTVGFELLFENGIFQPRQSKVGGVTVDNYLATTGNTITGLPAYTAGDEVVVLAFTAVGIVDVYTQAQSDARYVAKSSHVVGQGRLAFVSATQLKMEPFEGNLISIQGVAYPIPATLITNAGLAAFSPYFVYGYANGGVISYELSSTSPAIDPTYGYKIKSGDPSRRLLGGIFTNGAGQFEDSQTHRGVASWLNRKRKGVKGPSTANATLPLGGSLTEITSTARVTAFLWSEDTSFYNLAGSSYNSVSLGYAVLAMGVAFYGAPIGVFTDQVIFQSASVNHTAGSPVTAFLKPGIDGGHVLTPMAFVPGGGTHTFNLSIVGMVDN